MIMGRYPENLLNRCIASGIRVSRVERTAGGVSLRMRARDVKKLKNAARGSGCRVSIVQKSLAVRITKGFGSATVFLLTLIIGAIAMYALSRRVWLIRVQSEEMPAGEIIRILESAGVRVGALKRDIDLAEAGRALQWDDRVAYSKLSLTGIAVNVIVKEISDREPVFWAVCGDSIIASKDCIVGFISAESGRALVRKGQSVHAGDVLISGDLSDMKEGYLVPAKGIVLGETAYSASATAGYLRNSLERTGAHCEGVSLGFFGREIETAKAFVRSERECRHSAYLGFGLAVKVNAFTDYELDDKPVPDTPEGIRERAKLAAQEKLAAILPKDASIISAEAHYNENPDGSITALLTVITLEPIGVPTDH